MSRGTRVGIRASRRVHLLPHFGKLLGHDGVERCELFEPSVALVQIRLELRDFSSELTGSVLGILPRALLGLGLGQEHGDGLVPLLDGL